MNPKIKALTLGIILGLFVLTACAAKTPQPVPPTAAPDTTNLDTMLAVGEPGQAGQDETANKAVDIVRGMLASQLKVEASSLDLISVEPIDWSDACLGAAQEGEACAQVTTPGFRIVFVSGDQYFTYHTDLSAGLIRQETTVTQVS